KSVKGISEPEKDICELFVWLDDFYVFNTSCSLPDFEKEKITPYWNVRFNQPKELPNVFSTLITTADARSGEQSVQIRIPYLSKVQPGISCDISQQIIFR
ncbi:MAG: hypothetical protein NT126_05535, partial [Bacteroidetes bacterium]|nr:hypothetical protein [Bacteroidota bacterium]